MVVVVTNEETNVAAEVITNERGYFEVPYLVPGTYRLSIQVEGFKKFTQTGIVLTVNNRVEVPVTLDVGALVDEVTVAAQAPLLDTTSASASMSLSNRQVNSLPVFGNSAMLLTRSVPGVQWTGQPNYLGLHSNAGASGTNAAGGVGGTEYSLDGVSNSAEGRRVAYLPYTDTVAEIKVETASFDASKGHTSGATVSALTKSGTNAFRGSATWQYWNAAWNATQSTTNAAYYGAIEKAIAEGNNAEADGCADSRSRRQDIPTTGPPCSAVRSRCHASSADATSCSSSSATTDSRTSSPRRSPRSIAPCRAKRNGAGTFRICFASIRCAIKSTIRARRGSKTGGWCAIPSRTIRSRFSIRSTNNICR